MKKIKLHNCPFCKKHLDGDDSDTIYPNGSGWKYIDDTMVFVSAREVPKEFWCYKIVCECGAEMHGTSIDDAVYKWNLSSQ